MKITENIVRRPSLTIVVALFACSPGAEDPAASDYDLVTDAQGIMLGVLEPAAETYWDAVGWVLDFDGEHYFEPQDDEDWEKVLHAAYVIAEAGNLLMMEGRALDRGAWMGFSRDLVEVGRTAIAAAEAHDSQGVFDAGAEVYAVCSACHASYALQTLRPNDERADPVDVEAADSDDAGGGASDGSGS
jgi:hypothetical protein